MIASTRTAATVKVGDALPAFERSFTAVDLMAYGAATWDWHRLHYDLDFARVHSLSAHGRRSLSRLSCSGSHTVKRVLSAGRRVNIHDAVMLMHDLVHVGQTSA